MMFDIPHGKRFKTINSTGISCAPYENGQPNIPLIILIGSK